MRYTSKLVLRLSISLFIVGIVLLWAANGIYAATGINRELNFQGKIVNKTDSTNIANNTYSFTFKLYDAPSGGTQLPSGSAWSETQSLSVTDGLFQATIGATTTFPQTLDFNSDSIYLDVTFNSESFGSRVKLTAVPYAFNAEKVNGLTVTATNGTLTIPNGTTIAFAGSNNLTLSTTGITGITLPQSGTLSTLTGAETLTNKIIGTGGLTFSAVTDITTGTNENFSIIPNGTGKVGIGTTSPASMLSIAGGVGIGTTLVSSDYLNKIAPSGGLIVEGNVGIGTTNPLYKLDVAGTVNVGSTLSVNGFKFGTSTSSGYVLTVDSSGVGTWQAAAGGALSGGATNYLARWISATQLSTGVSYDNGSFLGVGYTAGVSGALLVNGNVGIGTTNPNAALQVIGITNLQGTTVSQFHSTGAISGATTLNIVGNSNLAGTTVSQFYSSGKLTAAGVSNLAGTTISQLSVTGISSLAGTTATQFHATGAISGATTLNITGLSTLAGTTASQFYSTGAIAGGSTLTIVGNTNLAGASATQFYTSGKLTAAGVSNLAGTTISQLSVTGISSLAGTTATQFHSTGAISGATTLNIVGLSTLAGTTASQFYSTGAIAGGSTLTIVGNSNLAGTTVSQFYNSGVSAFAGNVGIGTSSPVSIYKLYVAGALYGTTITQNGFNVCDSSGWNCPASALSGGATNYLARWISATQLSTGISYDNGSFLGVGYTAGTGGALLVNGNVGIGTTTVEAKLQVHGVGAFTSGFDGLSANYTNRGVTGGALEIGYDKTNQESQIASIQEGSAWRLIRYQADSHIFHTGGSAYPSVTFNSSGNVGIGTTIINNKLTVSADVTGTDYDTIGQLTIRGATNQNKVLVLGFDTTSDYGYIQASIDNSATKNLLLNPLSGNVGVGTTSPSFTLDVNGSISGTGVTTSTLTVTGLSTLAGATASQFHATGAISGGSTLNITGLSTLAGATASQFYSTGAIAGGSTLTIVGNSNLAGTTISQLSVTGISSLAGTTATQFHSTGAISGATTLNIVGLSTLAGTTASQFYSTGAIAGGSTLTIVGNSNLAGTTVSQFYSSGKLTAAGVSNLAGTTISQLSVTGISSLAGTTASQFHSTGAISGATTLNIVGNSNLAGTTVSQFYNSGVSGFSGNVGIGTSSPVATYKLYVVGAIYGTTITQNGNLVCDSSGLNCPANNLTGGATNYLARWISATQISTGVSYDTGSALGVGVTNPGNKLTVYGGFSVAAALNSNYVTTVAPSGGAIIEGLTGIGTTKPLNSLDVAGAMAVGVLPSTALPQVNMLYVSGNVGIGNSNPTYKFEVNGKTRLGGTLAVAHTVDIVASGSDTPLAIQGGSGVLEFWKDVTPSKSGSIGLAVPGDTVGDDIVISAFNGSTWSETARFTNGGNVGIGTSNPHQKLDIIGSLQVSGQILGTTVDSASSPSFSWNGDTNVGMFHAATDVLGFTTNGSEKMRVDSGGNVGIGTTAPSGLFSVSSISSTIQSNGLIYVDWSPLSATTSPADLVKINVGPNGTVGSLLNLFDNNSSIFSISQVLMSSQLPGAFNAVGDLGVAYDISLTNPTLSYIKSVASLYLQAGETFNSSNLTIRTFNAGNVVFDLGSTGSITTSGSNNLLINPGGNVGIGSTNPGGNKLKVVGSLCVKSNDGTCAGSTAGTIYATTTTISSADFAENYISSQELIPGDVVSVEGNGNDQAVVLSAQENDPKILGIISTQPGVLLNSDVATDSAHPKIYPVALSGRVPLRVSTQNGPIKEGDILTSSSIPGIAVKAIRPGPVIARALSSFQSDGATQVGTVMSFVSNGWYDPDLYISSTGNYSVKKNSVNGLTFYESISPSGETVRRNGAYNNLVSASLKTGSIEAEELMVRGVKLSDTLGGLSERSVLQGSQINVLGKTLEDQTTRMASLEARLAGLHFGSGQDSSATSSADLTDVLSRLRFLEDNLLYPGSSSSAGLEASGSAYIHGIVSSDGIHLDGSLTTDGLNVLGKARVDTLVATASISAGLIHINGYETDGSATPSASINSAVGPLRLQSLAIGGLEFLNGKINFAPNGDVQLTSGKIIGNDQFVGRIVMKQGTTTERVNKSWDNPPSAIILTPSYNTKAWVEEISPTGFVMRVDSSPETDKDIYWMATWK